MQIEKQQTENKRRVKMSSVKLENQKQLTGKCKTCLGCNRLEIAGFEGVDEFEGYMKR